MAMVNIKETTWQRAQIMSGSLKRLLGAESVKTEDGIDLVRDGKVIVSIYVE